MQVNKNLLRRFNGSRAQIEIYCNGKPFDAEDLNYQYNKADKYSVQPKFHRLGRKT